MGDIFISYVEEDADVVEPLARGLTEAGYSCWYYQRSSLPGASYLLQISEALAQAKVVLLVLSPQALESHQVDKEISFAHECDKPFLPITRNLAWGDFQQRRPTWRLAVGTSVAIPIPDEGVEAIVPRVREGLRNLGLPSRSVVETVTELARLTSAPPQQPELPMALALPVAPTLASIVGVTGSLPTRTAFVGRTTELEFLKAQYDAVAAGQGGRFVFISGDPGVGKTRLAHEVGLHAWSKGGLFVEGTYARDGTAPYGPWIDALKTGLRTLPRDVLSQIATAYGPELAPLFPTVISTPRSVAPPSLPPEEHRRRLFDGLVELVTVLSKRQPLVFVLNDLQWAPGWAALTYLAQRLGSTRALVFGTYREQEFKDQPALVREWAELNRARLAGQLQLAPLTEVESIDLVDHYFGAEPARQLGSLLYRRTQGNAFFLEEVLRSLTETGAIRPEATGWAVVDASRIIVPESMRLVVQERISRLGAAAVDLLTSAAVLGQEFSFPVLVALTGRPEDEVLDTVDRALSARLLTDRSTSGEERYAFADDQVQEVLYDTLTPPRRRRAHLRAAHTIETLLAGQRERLVEELAHHFRVGGDAAKAVEYALEAGENAYRVASWERAAHHFEAALEPLDKLPEDLLRRAHALERLADLDVALARPALEHAQSALELYVRLGNKKKAARMHYLIANAWGQGAAGRSDWLRVLEHGQSALDLLESEAKCPEQAMAHIVMTLGLEFGQIELERAAEHARRALAIAESLGDADHVATASTYLGSVLAHRGELAPAEAAAQQSKKAASRAQSPWTTIHAAFHPAMGWPWRNDRAWIGQWLERYQEERRRAQVERYDRVAFGFVAYTSALRGEPEKAADALSRAEEIGARRPSHWPYMLYFAAAAHGVLGSWERADRLFSLTIEGSECSHNHLNLLEGSHFYGRFLLARGDLVSSEAVLSRAYTLAKHHDCSVQQLNLLPLLGELFVRTERLDEAERSVARANELLGRPEEWRGLTAAVHRAKGLIAAAQRDWSAAEHAFLRAIDAERRYGFLYHEAHVLVPWAELYFQRGEPGDRERGVEKLDQALAIFERCAAKHDIERIAARRHSASQSGVGA